MKMLLLCSALLVGQINTLQNKPVVHLPANRDIIGFEYGGDLLQLSNSPAVMALPAVPPKVDSKGIPWSIDIKNLGPRQVTVVGKNQFSVPINIGRSVRIYSNGSAYSLKPFEVKNPANGVTTNER
jgi:hypothetical protein